jgi:protein-tyrosine phosphatase
VLREVSVPEVSGRLFLSRMPGRRGSFSEESKEIAEHGIDTVVSLTSWDEVSTESPAYAEAINADALPWERTEFPIRDFGVPTDRAAFLDLARSIAIDLQAGRRIVIHCGAGVGRTGTLAVCVLMALGMGRKTAEDYVDAARAGPENEEQRRLVRWVSEALREDKN